MSLVAATAVVALASGAGYASAATPPQWYTGATASAPTTLLTGSEALATPLANVNRQPFETGSPGSHGLHLSFQFFNSRLIAEIGNVECVGCTISNSAAEGAVGDGRLKFTQVKLSGELQQCTIADEYGTVGSLITRSLHFKLVTVNQRQFVLFSAPGNAIMQYQIGGAACQAVEGAKNLTGTFAAEPTYPLSANERVHSLNFTKQIQEAAGAKLYSGGTGPYGFFEGTLSANLPSGRYWNAK